MNKSMMLKLSKKLGWTLDELKSALDELDKTRSIADLGEILKICMTVDSPKRRYEKVAEYLLKKLKGDLSREVSNLLLIDGCFQLLALFNYYELSNTKKSEYRVFIEFSNSRKSFISWRCFIQLKGQKFYLRANDDLSLQDSFSDSEIQLHVNPQIYAQNLTYEFVETFMNKKLKIKGGGFISEKSIVDLFSALPDEVKFLAFNVPIFRKSITRLIYQGNIGANEQLNKVVSSKQNFSRSELTKKNHWLIYALATELQHRGLGVRPSFKKAGELLNVPDKTVQRRFYERKKEAQAMNLSLEDIVFQYNLSLELNSLLQGDTEDE